MSNGTFPINMRDMKFILYEQLGIERLCQFDKFKDFSRETFDMVLEEGAKLAAEVMAPLNSIADKEGCVYEKGKVKVPEAFHEAFKKYCEGGWIAASVDAEAGGQGLPESVALATAEMFVGACCSITTYPGLTRGCANLIESFGTPEQKKLYLEKMYSGQWTGTMCLTEPQAGSSVGDVKSMAKKDGDHYLIQGTKIFITAGDHNLTENIIHAVLARTENAPPGTKGLSLFIVPKVRINADGSLGEPNDVNCGGIEHKMGLKGSSTCTLNFGDDGKCHGYILGQENQGIQLMFQMMNEARLGVGLQGFALGNLAYLYALKYAKERIQGVEVTKMRDPNAPRVPIIKHPDIRRMLMTMKAYAEGLRALIYRNAYYADLAKVATDPKEKEYCENMIDSPDSHREGLFDRHSLPPYRMGHPGSRRVRVLRRISRGTALPGREDHFHLRGYQRHNGHDPGRPQPFHEKGRLSHGLDERSQRVHREAQSPSSFWAGHRATGTG